MYRKSLEPSPQQKSGQDTDKDQSSNCGGDALNKEEFRSESIAALRARAQAHAAMLFKANGSEQLSPTQSAPSLEIMDSSSSGGSEQEPDRADVSSE